MNLILCVNVILLCTDKILKEFSNLIGCEAVWIQVYGPVYGPGNALTHSSIAQ